MKTSIRNLVIASLTLITITGVAHADHDVAPTPPTYTSSPELERIKSLEGRWVSTTSMFGKKDQKVYTDYKVTADGSAVLESIFPGTPQEMISVYYDDNGKLAMTHYCIMHNRPTLKLASSTDDTINMNLVKVDGVKSKKDPSMGGMSLHFKDKNHFVSTCQPKGKEKSEPMSMEYTRVKPLK